MHGMSIEARLKDYKKTQKLKKEKRYPGCKFHLSIDCLCLGPHKFSFEYLLNKVYLSRPLKEDNKGIPYIEAQLKINVHGQKHTLYRKLRIEGKGRNIQHFVAAIPYTAGYLCSGHSYNPKDGSLMHACEGCKFYK
jgi:hypothetical protein